MKPTSTTLSVTMLIQYPIALLRQFHRTPTTIAMTPKNARCHAPWTILASRMLGYIDTPI